MLRALGATPPQIRRLIAGEALLVSLVAGASGSARRSPRSRTSSSTSSRTAARSGPRSQPSQSLVPLGAALGMGVLIAQLAVFAAARRAGRIPPADALREVAIEHPRPGLVRVLAGLAGLAGGVAHVVAVLRLLGDGVRGARRDPARDGHRPARALAARVPGRDARRAAAAARGLRSARRHEPRGEPLAHGGAGHADRPRRDAGRHPGHRRVQQSAPHRGRDGRAGQGGERCRRRPTGRRFPPAPRPRSRSSPASTPRARWCRRRSIRSRDHSRTRARGRRPA